MNPSWRSIRLKSLMQLTRLQQRLALSVSGNAFRAVCPIRVTVAHAWHINRLLNWSMSRTRVQTRFHGPTVFSQCRTGAQSSRLNIIITIFYFVLKVWRELWLYNRGFSVCWWDTHTISLFDISWQQHTETAGRYIHREQHCCQVNTVVWFANVSGEGCTYL